MELKKVQKQGKDEKLKNLSPLLNNTGPFSGLQCNALACLVHFVTYTMKQTWDASALHWRPERRPALFCSGGRVFEISHPCLVPVLFQRHPHLK